MEIVSMNFGQCGLQLANVYWTRVAEEIKKKGKDKTAYKSLYKNADVAELDSERPKFEELIPRCILVDSEMGPATQVTQESASNLISSENVVAGTDPAGNNWATAFKEFGSKYSETIEELVSDMLEDCDRVEYFNMAFGISGGTGSGLGTYALQMLSDLYPKIPKLANIVTNINVSAVSPYNDLLALNMLEQESTLIIPFSNDIIFETIKSKGIVQNDAKKKQKTYFAHINSLISDFQHKFNIMTVDLNYPSFRVNSIINSLLPFETMNYTSPFKSPIKEATSSDTNNLENIYNDLFRPVTRISPIPLDCAMTPISIAVMSNGRLDHLKYAKALKLRYKMNGWNRDGIKVNLRHPFSNKSSCLIEDNSIIALSNHTGISQYLDTVCANVNTLLNKKAFLHHFETLISEDEIRNTVGSVAGTSQEYKAMDEGANRLFQEVLEMKMASRGTNLQIPKSIQSAWSLNTKASTII